LLLGVFPSTLFTSTIAPSGESYYSIEAFTMPSQVMPRSAAFFSLWINIKRISVTFVEGIANDYH